MLSIFDDGPFPPCPTPFNMAEHVLHAGLKTPQKDALLVLSDGQEQRWSFAELRQAILGTATGLLNRGLLPGDVVMMRLGNTVDFPICYLGALAAGLVPVPTSAALSVRETAHLIAETSPKAVLHAPDVPCPPHAQIIGTDTLQGYRNLPAAAFDRGDPNRVGYIIFTSGTSGKPRAVVHAHRAIWARQMMFEDWYGLSEADRVLHAGAFNWTYTLGTGLMDPWTKGATALIPAPHTRPEALPDLMRAQAATIFAAAPGVYRQLLERAQEVSVPSLRHGLSAGEKLPTALATRWHAASGCPVYEAYGMSECSTFISHAPGRDGPAHTLGRPQVGRRIALVDQGQPVPRGTEGTIAIDRRDPGLMLRYHNAPEETAARFQGDWFMTGDQGVMDDDGFITYCGRNDDMMNAGGFRVSPIEVENVLIHHEGITAVAAAEVEVKQDTCVIAAFYTGPATLDVAALETYVQDKLARYKQPRLYIHLPELPMGANGKILRRSLRDRYERRK